MRFFCDHMPSAYEQQWAATPNSIATVRWGSESIVLPEVNGTHFVAASGSGASVGGAALGWRLEHGMFGAFPGAIELAGTGLAVTFPNWRGMQLAGGPVEAHGRLQYIDGCSSTVLIAPLRLGDPTMNFLRVPPGTDQTEHTHPSLRVGLIVSGAGVCRVHEGDFALKPGVVFCLPTDKLHSFHTGKEELRIIVVHPDSDVGPTDEDHPMLRRTIVQGVPAHIREDLRR